MEQSVAAAIQTIELNDLQLATALLLVIGLVVAIVGSLALLTKRNQSFISEVMKSK
jgi:hypothetical protein